MRTITKFPLPLPLKDSFSLSFPEGARVIYVAVEGRQPYMWLELNHDAEVPTDEIAFLIAKEGDELPRGKLVHLGSFRFRRVVRHLFEHLPESEAVTSSVVTNHKLYAERHLQAEK